LKPVGGGGTGNDDGAPMPFMLSLFVTDRTGMDVARANDVLSGANMGFDAAAEAVAVFEAKLDVGLLDDNDNDDGMCCCCCC